MAATGSQLKLSKWMSRALRHKPEDAGIVLDEGGWVSVKDLAKAGKVSVEEILAVVKLDDKQRYKVEGSRIRANQGHSVPVNLGLLPAVPPEVLYHGTPWRAVTPIMGEGLRPGRRHAVHLSPNVETATRVGERRGEAAILTVAAGQMHRDGFVFTVSDNGVWLTDHVPPGYITVPS